MSESPHPSAIVVSSRYDAAIVGLGPVGVLLANQLGLAGWRVIAFDYLEDIYPLPRAMTLDAESMRILQGLGFSRAVEPLIVPSPGTEFVNRLGRSFFSVDAREQRPLGWPATVHFSQPDLERVLRSGLQCFPEVECRTGHRVTEIDLDTVGARIFAESLSSGREFQFEASYLFGCDGSASFVREACEISLEPSGYEEDWFEVDVRLLQQVELPQRTRYVCDQTRRVILTRGSGNLRRFEFQILPGENAATLAESSALESLLGPWLSPEDAEVVRAEAYTFRSAVAQRWRRGRVFLVGDAAHQAPPHTGPGLAAGVLDTANLWWKLDLVRRGLASEQLLATYEEERAPHVRDVLDASIGVHQLIEALSGKGGGGDGAAGDRPLPHLHRGVLGATHSDDGFTGRQIAQPRVRTTGGRHHLLDDILGRGFAVLMRDDPRKSMNGLSLDFWNSLGARLVALPESSCIDDSLTSLFSTHDAVVVRPDRYVFGLTSLDVDLDGLTTTLREILIPPRSGRRRLHSPETPGFGRDLRYPLDFSLFTA